MLSEDHEIIEQEEFETSEDHSEPVLNPPEVVKQLVDENMGLIGNEVKHYLNGHHDLSYKDLLQEGVLGAVIAARRFDAERGYKFFTYAAYYVRMQVMKAIKANGAMIRLPGHIHQNNSIIQQCEKEIGEKATAKEIQEKSGLAISTIENTKRAVKIRTESLDEPIKGSETSATRLDYAEDTTTPDPEAIQISKSNIQLLETLLEELRQRNRNEYTVVRLCYGIGADEPLTLTRVGRMLGVSKERVRQIRDRGLYKLRILALQKKELSLQ